MQIRQHKTKSLFCSRWNNMWTKKEYRF